MAAYKEKRGRGYFTLFLIVWAILALFQAANTGLINDEAYYWMYSKYLDVGYFDHPPMVAWLIGAGSFFFNGEIGVRIIMVLLNILTLTLVYYLINPSGAKKTKILILLLLTLPIIHIGSFLAVPDVPLAFFSALFFYRIKKYLQYDNIKNALWVAVAITGMLYSKYHGILLIIFTLAAYPKFFKRKSLYLIIISSVLLFLPHALWQFNHNFVSLGYHLGGRIKGWSPLFIADYIGGQLLVFGILAAIPLFIAIIQYKKKESFTRILQVNILGIILFFLVASLKMHIEANWTICLFVPVIYLGYYALIEKKKLASWFTYLAIPSIILIMAVRVFMVYDFIPEKYHKKTEFHGWNEWAQQIKTLSRGRPVVFMNSYQKASKYSFYTGDFAHTINSVKYRKNQYDLWDFEERLQGEDVMFLPNHDVFELPYSEVAEIDSFQSTIGGQYYFTYIKDFKSVNKLEIEPLQHISKTGHPSERIDIALKITNPYSYSVTLDTLGAHPTRLVLSTFSKDRRTAYSKVISYHAPITLLSNETCTIPVTVTLPIEKGAHYLAFGWAVGGMAPGLNSAFFPIKIE